ncbi:hypothetical protein [Sporosarcina ureae]|uniref:hypothetical protein n=1 Tax=Sporosarcina ureae TaxID=1571 RepID=UPI0018DC06EE
MHDICLKQNGIYFQMDSVIITPTFILIIGAKKWPKLQYLIKSTCATLNSEFNVTQVLCFRFMHNQEFIFTYPAPGSLSISGCGTSFNTTPNLPESV